MPPAEAWKRKQTKPKQVYNLFKPTMHFKYLQIHTPVSMKAVKHSIPAPYWLSPQSSSFVRAKAELELAQYMLKSEGLMLHPEFLQRLRSLPQSYVYGEYRQIYRDYGTHYVTEAALGGDYEHTIILNKERLAKSGKTFEWL